MRPGGAPPITGWKEGAKGECFVRQENEVREGREFLGVMDSGETEK